MKTFREELQEYLARTNIKPYKLAKKARVSMVAVYGFLNSSKGLTVDTMEKLKSVMK